MRKLLLFFIDGLGIGSADSKKNPMIELFTDITGGTRLAEIASPVRFPQGIIIPTDAVMDVEGIPQSATGQTSIFTGVNAQKQLGYHLSAYPNDILKKTIEERSLMKKLANCGVSVTSANLYSKQFFEKRNGPGRNMMPASTLTIQASGSKFRLPEDYAVGKAVFADITNELIRKRGYDVALLKPERAARHMLNILDDYDFVFFEYFMTDMHGHKQNLQKLTECVATLNCFTSRLWEKVDRKQTAMLIVSDHGNCEDVSIGDHTTNAVPTILFSERENEIVLFEKSVKNLTDIYRAVCNFFSCAV